MPIIPLSSIITKQPTRRYLIINADDYGLSEPINNGIVNAHRKGLVTSTSMLANMPGFQHGLSLLQQHRSLGVGLHLNLIMGSPLSPPHTVPSLVGANGTFSWNIHAWRQADIEREAAAQLHKLYDAGIIPTHLDSHHHIHLEVPMVCEVVAQLANLHQLAVRFHSNIPCQCTHPLSTDHLILDTYHNEDGVGKLCHHIQQLRSGTTELMCHPGLYDDTIHPNSHHLPQRRVDELQAILDPLVLNTIEQHAQLIHYGHLSSFRASPSSSTLPTLPSRMRRRRSRTYSALRTKRSQSRSRRQSKRNRTLRRKSSHLHSRITTLRLIAYKRGRTGLRKRRRGM